MKKTPLPTQGKRKNWCGPYALAVIAGVNYDDAYDSCARYKNRLRRKRLGRLANRKPYKRKVGVIGFGNKAFEIVSKRLKAPVAFEACQPMALSRLADHLKPNSLYVVNVTRHYVVVDTHDWTVIDNQTKQWEPITECKHRRKTCRNVGIVGRAATKRFKENAPR